MRSAMVRPSPKHQGAPADVDLVSFINDFLFNQHEEPSSPSSLRRQRTPQRSKRYKSMWRAAATSLIAKRSASQETRLRFDQDRPLKNLPSSVSLHNANFLSADILPSELPSSVSLSHDRELGTTSYSQERINNNDVSIDVDTPPLATTRGGSKKDKPSETACTLVIPKHSSKKPPRPPRVGILRSGSHRAIRLKTATRRAMVEPVRMKKQKINKSASNATLIWALIITICFVSIMLVQGFFGNNSTHFPAAIEGQGLGEVVSLSPS